MISFTFADIVKTFAISSGTFFSREHCWKQETPSSQETSRSNFNYLLHIPRKTDPAAHKKELVFAEALEGCIRATTTPVPREVCVKAATALTWQTHPWWHVATTADSAHLRESLGSKGLGCDGDKPKPRSSFLLCSLTALEQKRGMCPLLNQCSKSSSLSRTAVSTQVASSGRRRHEGLCIDEQCLEGNGCPVSLSSCCNPGSHRHNRAHQLCFYISSFVRLDSISRATRAPVKMPISTALTGVSHMRLFTISLNSAVLLPNSFLDRLILPRALDQSRSL